MSPLERMLYHRQHSMPERKRLKKMCRDKLVGAELAALGAPDFHPQSVGTPDAILRGTLGSTRHQRGGADAHHRRPLSCRVLQLSDAERGRTASNPSLTSPSASTTTRTSKKGPNTMSPGSIERAFRHPMSAADPSTVRSVEPLRPAGSRASLTTLTASTSSSSGPIRRFTTSGGMAGRGTVGN